VEPGSLQWALAAPQGLAMSRRLPEPQPCLEACFARL
jgi:hypothetical protein